MRDGIEIPPTLRMIASIIDHVETFFAESGCPLNAAQLEAVESVRVDLSRLTTEQAAA